MPRRLIIHIGAPKCGSTFLQRALLQSGSALAAAGIRYPHDGGRHPGNAGTLQTWETPQFDDLFRGADTVILSHEDLFGTANRSRALLAWCAEHQVESQVIAFLRPFSDIVFGDYSQFMKQHFERYLDAGVAYDGKTFEDFALQRTHRIIPSRFLTAWQALTPGRPVTVAPHSEIRSVVEALIGPRLVNWSVPADQTNPSLRMEDCDRLAAMIADPAISRLAVRSAFAKAHRDALAGVDAGRTDERRRLVDTLFASEAEALRERFGLELAPAGAAPVRGG